MTIDISQHPAVRNYFAGLEQVLAQADPQERSEILDGVREHLDEKLRAFGTTPTDKQIADALAALGSPDDVADTYRQGHPDYVPGSSIPMRPLPTNIGWPGLIAAIIGVAFAILNPFIGVFWLTSVLVILITNRKSAANAPGPYYLALGVTVIGLLASLAIILGLISVSTGSADPEEPQPATAAVIGQEN